MTVERPMFPPHAEPTNNQTRRRLLAGAASLAAGGTALALTTKSAVTSCDPVYYLIEAYRIASVAHQSALDEGSRLQRLGLLKPSGMYEPACEACGAHNDAFWALIETHPTTLPGAIALLTFLNELAVADPWLFDVDGGELVMPLIANLARALPRLAVA
jgi:hypothetical protein